MDDATRNNILDGLTCNKNWKPKVALQGKSVGGEYQNAVLCLLNTIEITNTSCANPKNLSNAMLIDSAVQHGAPANFAKVQELNFFLTMPNGTTVNPNTTVCLYLAKKHNLLAVSELCDAGCTVIYQ